MAVGRILFGPNMAIDAQLACRPRHFTERNRCSEGQHSLSIDQFSRPKDSSKVLPWRCLSVAVNLNVQQDELVRSGCLTVPVRSLLIDECHICRRFEVWRRHLHLVQCNRVSMYWPFPKTVKLLEERQWSISVKRDEAVFS